MGIFLNTTNPYEAYRAVASTRLFVDKSLMIEELLNGLELDGQRYVCITRPRRFGKTVMAAMLAAFMGKAADSSLVFDRLAIAGKEQYKKHRNIHDVFYLDLSRMPENCSSYGSYISRILNGRNPQICP